PGWLLVLLVLGGGHLLADEPVEAPAPDYVRNLQTQAIAEGKADWGHWGYDPENYRAWGTHSNRLIPGYTFGMNLDRVRGKNSVYRDDERLKALFGKAPENTLSPQAEYFDQADIYHLQQQAVAAGNKH